MTDDKWKLETPGRACLARHWGSDPLRCGDCGADAAADDRRCGECGARLDEADADDERDEALDRGDFEFHRDYDQ